MAACFVALCFKGTILLAAAAAAPGVPGVPVGEAEAAARPLPRRRPRRSGEAKGPRYE